LTTPWGIRTLSSLDPKYHPSLYHDGAVWPIVTGWAAISEIKFNRFESALYYIESMAQRILAENGMYAETYRGDRPEPFNSCILQAWSVAMYVYSMQELILGMRVNLLENRIQFEPHIPESLRGNCLPLKIDHVIQAPGHALKLQIWVDPNREKLSVCMNKNGDAGRVPEICSDSYSIHLERL
jgi:glycogen debranching enzyme